ncbi:MAG: ParA family protein [bacterium]
MTRIIAIANQKGGVGKTTTCVNLSAALADMGRKVLVVDLDPQGNASMGCGVNSRELDNTGCELLLKECSPLEAIVHIEEMNFDLIPSNTDLTAAELRLMDEDQREMRLHDALSQVEDQYHYILIDCPPSLSILTLNALVAADGVLIPMQCEYYALEGLTSLLETVERVRESVNPDLELEGLIRTMFDVRNNLSNEVSGQLLNHFGEKVYRTIVPRNVRVAEAPSHGVSVIKYDRQSRGAIAYMGLAGEVMRRSLEQQQKGAA